MYKLCCVIDMNPAGLTSVYGKVYMYTHMQTCMGVQLTCPNQQFYAIFCLCTFICKQQHMCIHTHTIHIGGSSSAWSRNVVPRVHVKIYINTSTYPYTFIHTHTYIHVGGSSSAWSRNVVPRAQSWPVQVYLCMYACMYACICVCVYAYMCMCVCMYVCCATCSIVTSSGKHICMYSCMYMCMYAGKHVCNMCVKTKKKNPKRIYLCIHFELILKFDWYAVFEIWKCFVSNIRYFKIDWYAVFVIWKCFVSDTEDFKFDWYAVFEIWTCFVSNIRYFKFDGYACRQRMSEKHMWICTYIHTYIHTFNGFVPVRLVCM
jgi:hypothetical protein